MNGLISFHRLYRPLIASLVNPMDLRRPILLLQLCCLLLRPLAMANLVFHQSIFERMRGILLLKLSFLVEFDSDCMKAMCMADSGCVQEGCARDAFDRLGCGYFRMNIWQFKVRALFKVYQIGVIQHGIVCPGI
jgi:hypothetical protein